MPEREDALPRNDEELLARIRKLYGSTRAGQVKAELKRCEKEKLPELAQQIRESYTWRMGDLSLFMKELKQRFTQWYNRKEGRKGTLWEDRFKSVLVEDTSEALLTMAAYIDLNPVRAGIVEKPEDYKFCGYAEAVAGKMEARRGLALALDPEAGGKGRYANWRRTSQEYRWLLFGIGEERKTADDEVVRKGISKSKAEAENRRGYRMSLPEVLRHRVRYFADGAVFGTADFVNGVFEANRGRYGPKRKSGARKMKAAEWGNLRVLRDLQVDVVGSGS